jgi:hypothetical protein
MLFSGAPFQPASPSGIAERTAGMSSRIVAILMDEPSCAHVSRGRSA